MDRTAIGGRSPHQFAKTICVRRSRRDGEMLTVLVEYTDVQSFPDHPTFEFPLTPELLLDLTWLREISVMMYRLNATVKRCAKMRRWI